MRVAPLVVVVGGLGGLGGLGCEGPPPREVPTPAAAAPAAPAAAPVPASPAYTRVELVHAWGKHQSLCLHRSDGARDCLAIGWYADGLARFPFADDRGDGVEMVYRGKPCRRTADTLACEGSAPVAVIDESTHHYGYLRAGDRLWWYENWLDLDAPGAGGPRVLHDLRAFPGGLRQLGVAFRAACALAGDGSAWCWSDPRRPARARVPAGTVEIFVQEPFELCARTVDGAVTCSPASAPPDLACKKRGILCGEVPITDDGRTLAMRRPFDPLTSVLGPQQIVEVGHLALRLVRDETPAQIYCQGDREIRVDAGALGGCALGPAGELTCFAPCGARWDTYRITGLTAVVGASVEQGTGYAWTADGALYAWSNPARDREDCGPPADVAAIRVALPPVKQLTDAFFVMRGPHWTEHVRCAVVDNGRVWCWAHRPDGLPAPFVDPRALRRGSRGRP